MEKTQNQKKLLKILNEIFQLDRSDLDFGIYRIMNTKSQEINEFLDNELLSSVADAFSSNENNTIQSELDDAIKQAQSLGVDSGSIPKVKELKAKLSSTTNSSALENDVFSHLANFFKRYYKDGDFVSLRRYKKDTYAIPYEGEEVKLHWANSDQYYIKSGEYFRDYTFVVNDKTIHLKLSDAETESNNNKSTSDEERRFILVEPKPETEDNPEVKICEVINGELFINFEYRAIGKENQDTLNKESVAKALESVQDPDLITALNTLAPTTKDKKRTIFEKHLQSYTSRNSFDYFIHKDLGGFLSRELDFYIKNEILFLDDIMDSSIKYEEVMGKIKIFKEVASKIISFLTQLEELQKELWEKKKIIIETNYCITLDKINEDYYEDILVCDEQLKEWKTLFDVDVKTIDDLKEEKYLVLDTQFFDTQFKYKLLSEFDNLDEAINGVLINSENFGALNLLKSRFQQKIDVIYIDPPYNTSSSEIIYKNSYKHSSWLSFMDNRVDMAYSLLQDKGNICVAIDDEEVSVMRQLLASQFSKQIGIVPVRTNPVGRKTKGRFTPLHEYALFFGKSEGSLPCSLPKSEKGKKRYPHEDETGRYTWLNFIRTGNNDLRTDSPKMYYPIIVDSDDNIRVPKMRWSDNLLEENISSNEVIVYPIVIVDGKRIEKNWQRGYVRLSDELDEYRIRRIDGQIKIDFKARMDENALPITWWDDAKYASSNYGAAEMKELFINPLFSYPKSRELVVDCIKASGLKNDNTIVCDFFAGSGTTGDAVIKINRNDNGNRKYILVEMGEYFDTVTKPRIQKVIYSDKWKNGKPTTKNGISQIFKYFKLESYEDTLNNLEFKRTKEQGDTLGLYPEAKDDYILNYSLDVESQGSLLNIDTFRTPFNYKLKIATSSVGETKDTNVDLVETFNYLLGLVVKRIELLKGYLVVEGQNIKKEKILIIWRDGQSSADLNEFFKKMDWSVYDREFDTIYVNGDNNLDNLRKDEDHFKVKLIEEEFKNLMFSQK